MPLETRYPPLARRPDMMHTYLVSVSMVWMCTLLWVWERTASCWAHFKQRPPTRLEAPAARRDSLCFNLSLRSSQVFWYSTKSFLKERGKILGNVRGKVQCFQMKQQRERPPPSVVWHMVSPAPVWSTEDCSIALLHRKCYQVTLFW